MTEKQIEQKLCEAIKRKGGLAYKFVSPGRVGVPDRILILPGGRVVFVEVKTLTGKLSRIQKFRLDEMWERGAEIRVLYGLEAVEAFVEEL
jgi:hypothetical protein